MRPLVLVPVALLALAAPAAADRSSPRASERSSSPAGSKLAKEGIQIEPRGAVRGKDKRCCGYPLAADGAFALRFYWLAMQDSFDPVDRHVPIYLQNGFFIGSFPERFVRALLMEGSGLLSDGRVINYDGRCRYGVGTCYEPLDERDYPFGRGARRRPLVPFVSVAVDPRLVPIGEPLYVPELDGLLLPDGSIHDGCVRADDTGGNIKKRKMDFFVVSRDNFRALVDALGATWITPHIEHPRCQYLRQN
ncbi:MAG TPA: 3D domain-containing protein, partial [Kofleriaceae bacterium]|nr:3D domain-containing protein [Kofleriaceae bacterium]